MPQYSDPTQPYFCHFLRVLQHWHLFGIQEMDKGEAVEGQQGQEAGHVFQVVQLLFRVHLIQRLKKQASHF
jgi:hypothetical protein